MFQEYESSGKHMVCDFKGIENIELLNSMSGWKDLLKEICKNNDFKFIMNLPRASAS
jgi:hypothetical protein